MKSRNLITNYLHRSHPLKAVLQYKVLKHLYVSFMKSKNSKYVTVDAAQVISQTFYRYETCQLSCIAIYLLSVSYFQWKLFKLKENTGQNRMFAFLINFRVELMRSTIEVDKAFRDAKFFILKHFDAYFGISWIGIMLFENLSVQLAVNK